MFRKHHHLDAQQQKEGWVQAVPEDVMTGDEMRDRFIATNRMWLLRHLPQVLDDEVMQLYQDQLAPLLQDALAEQKRRARRGTRRRKRRERQPLMGDVSDRQLQLEGPSELPPPQPSSVELALRVRVVALNWLMRARRRLVMVSMVSDIRMSEMAAACAQCGGEEELQVEEFVEARELWSQFDWLMADTCRGWSGAMKAAYAEQNWRVYYHQSQSFRTRCWRCRVADLQARPLQPSNVNVSDDEEDEQAEPCAPQQPNTFVWAAMVAPVVARFVERLKLRQRQHLRVVHLPPLHGPLPAIKQVKATAEPVVQGGISDDEGEEEKEEVEEAKEEQEPLRDDYRVRPTMAAPEPVRGDISSDDEDEEETDALAQQSVAREGEDAPHLFPPAHFPALDHVHGLSLNFPAAAHAPTQLLGSGTEFDAQHFHFTAQPTSARKGWISDDSDSDDDDDDKEPGALPPLVGHSHRLPPLPARVPAPANPRGEISDSDEEDDGLSGRRQPRAVVWSNLSQLPAGEVSPDTEEDDESLASAVPQPGRVELDEEGKEHSVQPSHRAAQRYVLKQRGAPRSAVVGGGGGRGGPEGGRSVGAARGGAVGVRGGVRSVRSPTSRPVYAGHPITAGGAGGRAPRPATTARSPPQQPRPSALTQSLLRAQRVYAMAAVQQRGVQRSVSPDQEEDMMDDPDWAR